MTLKGLARQIKSLLAGDPNTRDLDMPDTAGYKPVGKREQPTPFQAAWAILKKRREDAGLLVGGETRRCLRAKLMKAIKEKS